MVSWKVRPKSAQASTEGQVLLDLRVALRVGQDDVEARVQDGLDVGKAVVGDALERRLDQGELAIAQRPQRAVRQLGGDTRPQLNLHTGQDR